MPHIQKFPCGATEHYLITYTEKGSDGNVIEEVYKLGYVPEGYYFDIEVIAPLCVQYKFKNDNSDYIYFEQKTIDGTDFIVDNDDGYSQINEITNYEIYFRYANDNYVYVWNNCKYSMFIRSNLELSGSELILIIEGLTVQ